MPTAAASSDSARRRRIVLPVKPLQVAKQRLAMVLTPAQRSTLVEAMLRDVLAALDRGGLLGCTLVVTNDAIAGGIAAAAGAEVRPDPGGSYNAVLARMARELELEGASSVAVVPADLPTLAPADLLDALAPLGQSEAGTVVLAADRHGDGTNLLVSAPPSLLAPSYGPGSFRRHRAVAVAAGAAVRVVAAPGLGLDVDTPDDLAELQRRCETADAAIARATRAWLEQSGVGLRLQAVERDVH